MRCSVIALLALVALVALASVAPAAASTKCGFAGLDFSDLATEDFTYGDPDGFMYAARVCGVTAAPVCHGGSITSMCQWYAPDRQLVVLGIWTNPESATWSYIDPTNPALGVQYTIKGQDNFPGYGQVVTTMKLTCAATQGSLTASYMGGPRFTLTLPTPLACGAKPPPKCGWNGLDFDDLTTFDVVGYDSDNTYYMHLCSPVYSQPACLKASPTATTAACMVPTSTGSAGSVDVGDYTVASPPAWGWIEPSNPAAGVGYTITSAAATCTAEGGNKAWTTNINLSCAFITGPMTISTSGCTLNMTKPTPEACPPSSSTNMQLQQLEQPEAEQGQSIFA